MKSLSYAIGALMAANLGAAAQAAPVTLSFDGLDGANGEAPGDFYNGGHGSLGAGPGLNFGVTFSEDALVVCSISFSCDDPHIGDAPRNVLRFLDPRASFSPDFDPDAPTVMDVAGGFTDSLSFIYAQGAARSTVRIWSGAHGAGLLMGEVNLASTCDDDGVCAFESFSQGFAGVAHSVEFVNFDFDLSAVDDITLNLAEAGAGGVPEPATWALMIAGFGLAGVSLRRRRTAAA